MNDDELLTGNELMSIVDDFLRRNAALVRAIKIAEIHGEHVVVRALRCRGIEALAVLLEKKAEKTRIVTKKEGFDFLGFTIEQPRLKLFVKPRKKNVHGFLEHVRGIIRSNKQAEQRALISLLNPVFDGWARYFQYSDAGRIFTRVDAAIWSTLWHWAKRRHLDKNHRWILQRYFGKVGTRAWCFRDEKTGYTLKGTNAVKRKEYTFAVGSMSVLDRAWLGRNAGYRRSVEESEHVEYK